MISVDLQPVSIGEKPLLWKLLQEYLGAEAFEGSEKFKDEQGNWKYPYFDKYWEEAIRFPFFILHENAVSGFALVRILADDVHSVAEFYVFREHWRKGIGSRAMQLVLDRFPDKKWKISYLHHNLRAAAFWKHWVANNVCDAELEEVHPLRDEA